MRRGYAFIDGGYLRNAILRDLMNRQDIAENPISFSTFIRLFSEKYLNTFSDIEVNRILYYDGIIPPDKNPKNTVKCLNFSRNWNFN